MSSMHHPLIVSALSFLSRLTFASSCTNCCLHGEALYSGGKQGFLRLISYAMSIQHGQNSILLRDLGGQWKLNSSDEGVSVFYGFDASACFAHQHALSFGSEPRTD